MKTIVILLTILLIIFGSLYFLEVRRSEQLRGVIDQRNRAFVTLKSITNGLINLSNVSADTLIVNIATSTQVHSNSSTSYIIGITLENSERYSWDFDVIEVITDSTGQLKTVELFKQ